MDHSALYVVNNAKSKDADDGNVTGDLINAHTTNRYHAIWNRDQANTRNYDTRIYAFELKS